jgi:hypothetical protein
VEVIRVLTLRLPYGVVSDLHETKCFLSTAASLVLVRLHFNCEERRQ